MNRAIELRLNVLGVNLDRGEIDLIMDFNNQSASFQREWLANFFSVEQAELTRNILTRYAEADNRMLRISAGSIEDNIHTNLINTLASAKRCYSLNEVLASIELCALHAEMMTNYLCITNRDVLYSDNVVNNLTISEWQSQQIERGRNEVFFSNRLNQRFRLTWLRSAEIISNEDESNFLRIHELRRKYFHHWVVTGDLQGDALDALFHASFVAAKFLELLNNPVNQARVRTYMDVINFNAGGA